MMKTKLQSMMIAAFMLISVGFANAQEWEKSYSGYNYIYTALDFPENQGQIGYAAGGHITWNGNGIVIKTTDGGDTWTSMWTGNNQGIEGMSFPSVDLGFVVGFSGYFGKTTDGGETWTTIDLGINPAPSVFYEVIFKDASNGIVFPFGDSPYITNDGGATWTAGGETPGAIAAGCYVSGNTYFGVGSGRIMKTEDGGLTWISKFHQMQLLLTGIRFFDENNGIALSEDGKYLKTTDGGENWTQHTIAGGFPLWRDVAWVDNNELYIVGTPEQIWKSEDAGQTWANDYPETANNQAIYEVQVLPNGTIIAGASQGYIFRKQAEQSEIDYPFTEDFEGDLEIPAGWMVYNQSGDEQWFITDLMNNTPEGTNSAVHNFGFGMQDSWLVTPQISMPEEGYHFLTFWQTNMDASWYAKNSVLVSAGSPDPADDDYVEVWTEDQAATDWTQIFIDLEDYAGQDIYIAFRYEGDYAHIWFVDDVALGEELVAEPHMVVSTEQIEQSVGQNGTANNAFTIFNEGIGSLNFDIGVDYIDEEGWLSFEPVSGSVLGNSSELIELTFNGSGYDFGSYEATITITGNDTENPEATVHVIMNVIDAGSVNLVVLENSYTFPVAISENGQHVVGTPFGGASGYYWSEETGVVIIAASADGVSNDGVVVVTYDDPDLIYNGNSVQVTGRWSFDTDEIEFLGMNPVEPEFFMNDYNSGWGMSSDGTVVGMQYYPGFNYKAYSWTEDGGYDNIGDHPDLLGNRPNGITGNGEIVYGWSQTPSAGRSPAIWQGDEVILLDATMNGEAWCGSPNAHYVAGNLGGDGFIWNSIDNEYTLFQNTINNGSINPAAVSNDGYVFGFTAEGFPPLPTSRRAFVRNPGGILSTFNDYAIERGWFEAADWIFYAITGVSGDGNRFIGAGVNPDGDSLTFMIDFAVDEPAIEINPLSLSEHLDVDDTSEQILEISNTGTGNLIYNAVIQYIIEDAKIQEVPLGRSRFADRRNLELAKKENTDGFHPATKANDKNDIILNYDGANVDAIGLIAGGTFYGAARYPSEMVAPFGGYMLESVDVYIGDIPTEIKLMIWDAGTSTSPGALIHEQVFTPESVSWNTVTLDEALEVSGADLWVGFGMTHDAGVFVLGIDGGPANMNGNWLSEDAEDWEHLSDYGLTGNWNIRAKLQYDGIQWLTLDPASGNIEEDQTAYMNVNFDATDLMPGEYTANIRINSNAVNEELVIVPVNLEVSGPEMYTLTLLVNPEDAGVVTGAGEYEEGSVVTVNATANEGYLFVNWTDNDGNVVSNQAQNDIAITDDITLTANFEEIPPVIYTLTLLVNPEDAGVVTGAGEYEEGSVVTVNATANEGYDFLNWKDADNNIIISEDAENEITITGDLTLIANFQEIVSANDLNQTELRIFPNPADWSLYIDSDEHITMFELFNLTGQKVLHTDMDENVSAIDVSSVPEGFYMVKITTAEGKIHSARILIAR